MEKKPDVVLRLAIAGNAAFSLLTGGLLVVAPSTVGRWLDVTIHGWLRLLGVALLGHALILLAVGAQGQLRRWGWLNLAAIAPYPLLMVVVVVAGWVTRPLGVALVLIDGAVVGAIALAHVMGLREAQPMVQAQPA